jgi:thymidylate synthase
VTIEYRYPKQHVLLSPIRDANPFFHLMESMWMLAGREDSAFLENYIKDFGKLYGTNGVIMDAYGQRWRCGLFFDQLEEIIDQLKKDSTTRQAVLQIWGAGRVDLRASKSKPCNLVVLFRIIENRLTMTVCNRSNDLIWGCCGANAVHFPILQEYMAGRLGMEIGEYWQISNNLHMYMEEHGELCKQIIERYVVDQYNSVIIPLVEYPEVFDEELLEVMHYLDILNNTGIIHQSEVYSGDISNIFLREVVTPMAIAHRFFKLKNIEKALEVIEEVAAEDWKLAGKQWLERRHVRS